MRPRPFAVALLLSSVGVHAATPPPSTLRFAEFAREPMVRNVVAVTVDELGRVYATSVVRRQAADLDIRRFPEWIEADLALDSTEAKLEFLRRQLTPAASDTFAGRFEDTNRDGSYDFRDLALLADSISRLEDRDGDGRADHYVRFEAAENTPVTGIAAGLAAWDGALYVAVEPDLVRLEDADGDGLPERRHVLAHGFSHHIGYGGHNFSGTVVGPDGRIYASVADRGMHVVTPDGLRHYAPHTGAIVRAELDGSSFEIFATGLRNLQEPAFDAWGNMLGIDNDGDMPGEKERFVYVAEGSDAGWRTFWQYRGNNYNPWRREGLDLPPHPEQPAWVFPPLDLHEDGPAGFAYNPGTALSPAYRDFFFLSAFPSRLLYAFRAEPVGAAFRMVDAHVAASGVLMVGLAFGPDGRLYVADWSADGYEMNEKGAVWTLDDPAFTDSPERRETARLLALDWRAQSLETLRDNLAHADQRVRMKAQFELARRDASAPLLATSADRSAHPLARAHAVWGLGQLLRRGVSVSSEALLALLSDPDAEIRAQTAKIVGEARPVLPDVTPGLVPLLSDTRDRPRFFAAVALGRTRHDAATNALLDYLKRDGRDPYHRHAAVMGLAGCASAEALAAHIDAQERHERLGAVVALRRQRSPLVSRFLSDPDPLVVAEAASAVYDDESIPDALPALAALLDRPDLNHEPTARRALGAALRLREASYAARVASLAADETKPTDLRLHALELLRVWPEPPALDPVLGAWRKLPSFAARALADTLAPTLRAIAKSPLPDLARAAWETAATYAIAPAEEDLVAIVEHDTPLAGDALRTLQRAGAPGLRDLAHRALQSAHPEVAAAALAVYAESVSDVAATTAAVAHLESSEPLIVRAALEILAASDLVAAQTSLRRMMLRLADGTLPPELALDVLEAAQGSTDRDTRAIFTAYSNSKDASDPLAPFRETLHGGDPLNGRRVFETSVAAQCTLCHRIDGPGSNVGPRLDRIGLRDPEYLLRALVLPGADIAPGYGFTTLTLRDGETIAGTLLAEDTENALVRLSDATERTVPLAEIVARTPLVSSMPPMGQVTSRRELRDLLAYLQTLR
jgi:putative membrane-bound dehydrogenase-like protein